MFLKDIMHSAGTAAPFDSNCVDIVFGLLSGIENKQCVLYMEDHQIVENAFLEDINSMLRLASTVEVIVRHCIVFCSAGEVPGLYTTQELDPLLNEIKEAFGAQGPAVGCRNVAEYFVYRVKQNLHIVLSMDPSHHQFGSSNLSLLSTTDCCRFCFSHSV